MQIIKRNGQFNVIDDYGYNVCKIVKNDGKYSVNMNGQFISTGNLNSCLTVVYKTFAPKSVQLIGW